MQIKTKPYIDLLEQLRMVAINSNSIDQRNRMRDNMLRLLLRTFDASSVYICQHDTTTHQTKVRNHFIGTRAKQRELVSDLGETFDDSNFNTFLTWLYNSDPEPLIIDMSEVDLTSAEYEEYQGYDLASLVYAVLHREGTIWGYIEIWDSRHKRTFNETQINKLKQIVLAINDTLLTPEG